MADNIKFDERGLSPLARGTQAVAVPYYYRTRFIPARAGNTDPGNVALALVPVYPRSRGEH